MFYSKLTPSVSLNMFNCFFFIDFLWASGYIFGSRNSFIFLAIKWKLSNTTFQFAHSQECISSKTWFVQFLCPSFLLSNKILCPQTKFFSFNLTFQLQQFLCYLITFLIKFQLISSQFIFLLTWFYFHLAYIFIFLKFSEIIFCFFL